MILVFLFVSFFLISRFFLFALARKLFKQYISSVEKNAESTARAWFEIMGWHMWEKKKGLYVDGHERDDVVEDRKKFLDSISPFQSRMETYSGDNMEIVHPPVLAPGVKRIVLVVQDESTVAANDAVKRILVEKGHEPIFPKGEGASKMISGFCCPCHGPLQLTPEQMAAHPDVAP